MSICWNFPSNNNGKISGISEAGICYNKKETVAKLKFQS